MISMEAFYNDRETQSISISVFLTFGQNSHVHLKSTLSLLLPGYFSILGMQTQQELQS